MIDESVHLHVSKIKLSLEGNPIWSFHDARFIPRDIHELLEVHRVREVDHCAVCIGQFLRDISRQEVGLTSGICKLDVVGEHLRCHSHRQVIREVAIGCFQVLGHEGGESDHVIGRVLAQEMVNHLVEVLVEELNLIPAREVEMVAHRAHILRLVRLVEVVH